MTIQNTINLLAQTTLKCEGFYSADLDGLWGPASATAALAWQQHNASLAATTDVASTQTLSVRTLANIATLDPKAQGPFRTFMEAAQLIAKRNGGRYEMISGRRTWLEQERLYAVSQAGGPHAAAPGYSFHNYGCAADMGFMVMFNGREIYMDGGDSRQQALAEQVHADIGMTSKQFGLIWGGIFSGRSTDTPHFQMDVGHLTPTNEDRAKFQASGSIL